MWIIIITIEGDSESVAEESISMTEENQTPREAEEAEEASSNSTGMNEWSRELEIRYIHVLILHWH